MKEKCLDLLEKARNNLGGLRFSELQRLCKCAGMWFDRSSGSHFIYKSENPSFTISIQKLRDGKAKSYQVKQLLDFIEEHNLDRGE